MQGRWEGRYYGLLAEAASALESTHPEAAAVLYRALLDDILARGLSAAYAHGAKYLGRLEDIAKSVVGEGGVEDHASYRLALKKAHGRKYGFWSSVDEAETGGGSRRGRSR